MIWYGWILTGFIAGMVLMYLLMKPGQGNDYTIKGKLKNKGIISDNEIHTAFDLEKPEKSRKLPKIFKRKNK